MLDATIAALNDKQRFNSQEVVTVLDIVNSRISKDSQEVIKKELSEIAEIRNGTSKGKVASQILTYLDEVDISEYANYLSEISSDGVNIITIFNDKYPENLKSISDLPLCLYIDGEISSIESGITVVGTRSATDQRIDISKKISRQIVKKLDKSVVSGLANGIDEAAHQSSINNDGITVAVLPSDIKSIKPSSNEDLGKEITQQGALLSEISSLTGFHKGRYLERNRITSGLSDAVIIAASKDSGGTIKQAQLAAEQNKPRYLYVSPKSDNQSPKKLVEDLGFKTFNSVEELMDLLSDSEFFNKNNTTLNDF